MLGFLVYAFSDLTVSGLIGYTNYIMPSLTPRSVQFGVRIPPDRIGDNTIVSLTRKFRLEIIVVTAMIMVIAMVLAFNLGTDAPLGYSILVELIAAWTTYYITRRKLRSVKIRMGWTKGYVQKIPAPASRIQYNSHMRSFMIIPPVMVIALTAIAALVFYPSIPSKIPIVFSGDIPVKFVTKSLATVMIPIYYQLFILGAMAMTFLIYRRVRIEPEYPDLNTSALRQLELRSRLYLSISILISFMDVGFLISGMADWELIPGIGSELSILPTMFGLIAMVYVISDSVKKIHKVYPEENTIPENFPRVMNRDDDRFWKMGFIYFNRDDPALMVPKRFGIGYTINMGNSISWAASAIIGIALAIAFMV